MKNTVIFDLDGTLLDTLDDLTNSANYTMDCLGCPARTRSEIRSFVGNGILVLLRKALPKGTEEETVQKALTIFSQHYGAHCNDLTKPYQGIPELIRALQKKNIKTAIVSNKPDFAVKELASIYFKGTMPVAIGENESAGIRKKPAPDTVFKALELLGSTAEESVYVGDSEVDIDTARNARMDAILCSWGFRDEDFLRSKGAEIILHEPLDLLEVL